MSSQYLSEDELTSFKYKKSNIQLTPVDNYDEHKIFNKLKNAKNIDHLIACAAHVAIIGIGNKTYGNLKINDKDYKVEDILKEFKVQLRLPINSKLKEDDLTVRRIVRFFRYQIKAYIKETGRFSYLWKKYNGDVRYAYDVFPGAEHLCDKEIGLVLYKTYQNLDKKLNINISDRIIRVLGARGLYTYEELLKLNSE